MTAIEKLNKSLERHRRFVRLLWICVPLINVFVVLMVVTVISLNREKEVDDAVMLTGNYSKILEQDISGFIKAVDITLLTVHDEVRRQMQQGGIRAKELEDFLARHDSLIPDALGLRVADASGIIRYAVKDVLVPNASIADRPQFVRLKQDARAGLVFSKPMMGRVAQKWLITLGRRIDAPDGSFGGDVHVAVALNYFIDRFAKIDLGPNGTVALWDQDTLLARYTKADTQGASVGATTPSPELHRLLSSNVGETTYHARSGIDGVTRTFSFRRIDGYPLYLVVGLADEDYLAEWQRNSLRLVGLAGLFVASSLLAAAYINRSWRQNQADHERLILQEEEYTIELEISKREAEAARLHSDLILSSAGEGICGVNRAGVVTFVNPAARRMFGWSEDEGIGIDLHATTHFRRPDGSDYPRADCSLYQTLQDGIRREAKNEYFWRKDGSSFAVEFTATAIEQDGAITGAVTVFRDVTERKELEARIKRMALFDQLTDLPNRAFLADALGRFSAMARRRNEIAGIYYLDLDGFKHVNDTMGHAAGDAVLREVAARLLRCVRSEDVVARLGGDEFLILALQATDKARDYSADLATRVIATVSQPISLPEGVAGVGASIGIALFPCRDYSIEQCVQQADAAMYQAKKAGKGCFAFGESMDAAMPLEQGNPIIVP